ncbi:pi038 [Candida pseudojiufengensis]|uniref:pi038 n=1 Tax=Candida pseudojiufengensis TaxID=497109 RepID=UPI00222535C0|nr:pi038 [Candida pseudojiufengensis]KAI5966816.1 pi038 [Candida pseudojiufengensis]
MAFKLIKRQMSQSWKPRYYDIGVNFSDAMFQGYYNGSSTKKHPCDIEEIIKRAHLFNVEKMLITASTIKESKEHFKLCKNYSNQFYSTAGVHPCSVAEEFYENEFTLRKDVDSKLEELTEILKEGYKLNHIKAFGEIGLDYDRLHYSTKDQQTTMFQKQLDILTKIDFKIPLFLHMRAACDDFVKIIKPYVDSGVIPRGFGVVHSFTGTEDELQKLLDLGFYIGINGCSLKTEDNLTVASKIPVDKLMIETDSPWCEIRKSHASYQYITPYPNIFYPKIESSTIDQTSSLEKSTFKLDDHLLFPSIKKEHYQKHSDYVERNKSEDSELRFGILSSPMIKSRNEPVEVGKVAEVLCKLHGITEQKDIEIFIDTIYNNSVKLFNN